MKFRYNGDCKAGAVTVHGVEFKKGHAVEVKDEFLIGKLSNNSHFDKVATRRTSGNGNKSTDTNKSGQPAGDQGDRPNAK